VRTADHNYIWDRKNDRYLLFNYTDDPIEKEDLFEDESGLVETMDSVLKTWLFRVHRGAGPGQEGEQEIEDDGGMGDDYTDHY